MFNHLCIYYEDHEWKVKTEDAKQASDTFSTKKEAKQRAKENSFSLSHLVIKKAE
jgi:hypothetical protein